MDDRFVVAINRATRKALISDNSLLPITTLLDSEGEETEDIHRASAFVAGQDGIGWFAGDIDDFPPGFIQ